MSASRFETGPSGFPTDVLATAIRGVDVRELRLPPTRDEVVRHVKSSVALTAVGTSLLIKGKYGDLEFPFSTRMTDDFKKVLDNEATRIMKHSFNSADFELNVVICEGRKEERAGGINAAVDILSGRHGRLGVGRTQVGVDVLEGTTVASLGKENATSAAAGNLNAELPYIPDETGDAIYLDRVIAGHQLVGLEPGMKVKDMFEVAKKNIGIVHPRQLEIVALNRPRRNKPLIEQAQDAGVTLTLIKAGDLVPGYKALQPIDMRIPPEDRHVLISAGGGGKEEGALGALGAHALEAVFWGHFVNEDGEPSKDFPGLKTLDWIKGNRNDSFVCIASVTGTDPRWFGLKPVRPHVNGNPNGYIVNGFEITSAGIVPFTLFV